MFVFLFRVVATVVIVAVVVVLVDFVAVVVSATAITLRNYGKRTCLLQSVCLFNICYLHFIVCLNTGVNISSSIEDLKQISDNVVDVVQRGALAQQANVTVVSLSISDPIPPPVDLTGGVRATNETGK